eukprot:scaffold2694_cov157-Isochrysis_galbana.AAC.1
MQVRALRIGEALTLRIGEAREGVAGAEGRDRLCHAGEGAKNRRDCDAKNRIDKGGSGWGSRKGPTLPC